MGIYNKANGHGYGRLMPVAHLEVIKLLFKRGFEMFPCVFRDHEPFTGYLYLCQGGAKGAVRTGQQLAEKLGVPATGIKQEAQWLNPAWRYRMPVTVQAHEVKCQNQQVSVTLNLQTLPSKNGEQVHVNPRSLRLVEVHPAGVVDAAVPCQYVPDPTAGNTGTLTFVVLGGLEAQAARGYLLYFDTDGHHILAPTSAPLESVVAQVSAQDAPTITTGLIEQHAQ
jgi:hypothetical protein